MKSKVLLILLSLVLLIGVGCSESSDKEADPPSTNANLSDLVIDNPAPSSYTFAPADPNYDVTIASDSSSIDITPTAADANATIQVKAAEGTTTVFESLASGATKTFDLVDDGYRSKAVPIYKGNVITIEVTAEDQTTVKTYTVTVTANEPL